MKLMLSVLVFAATGSGQLQYTKSGEFVFPKDYRSWPFWSSGIGMTYSNNAVSNPRFSNVCVNTKALQVFLRKGEWPDKRSSSPRIELPAVTPQTGMDDFKPTSPSGRLMSRIRAAVDSLTTSFSRPPSARSRSQSRRAAWHVTRRTQPRTRLSSSSTQLSSKRQSAQVTTETRAM
jgi:hypothetical protein